MVPDHFLNDEIEKFFGKIGIEVCFLRKPAKAFNLLFFATGISRGQIVFSLKGANLLGDAETLGNNVDEGSIEIVD